MMKMLINNAKNLSIKYKLFMSYLLLIVIPLIIFIVITFNISLNDAKKKTMESAKKMLSQASNFLEYKTGNIKNVLDIAALDTNLQEILNRNSNYYKKNIGNAWADNSKFYNLSFSLHSNTDISNVSVYMYDGIAAIEETPDFKLIKRIENKAWYKAFVKDILPFEWLPSKYFPETNSPGQLCFLKKVLKNGNVNDFIGIIKVDVNPDVINDLLGRVVLTKSTSVILTDKDNNLISYSGEFDNLIFRQLSKISPDDIQPIIWKTTTINNKKMLIGSQLINKTGMKLSIVVPYFDISEFSFKLAVPMITILVVIILLIIPLSFLISTSGTKRIRLLTKHIKKVQKGDISPITLKSNNDEIGNLINNFNYMIEKITLLMDDKFKLGKALKNNELKALQSQINPHFLYNTLDLINWMSMKYKAPEITEVVNSLCKFYKMSLSNGKDIITIENELELTTAYIQIQNMRFGNAINYIINIPKEIYKFTIPKITLQPIVENSILHGILETDEETGSIVISGKLQGNIITISIKDDGIGMSEEQVNKIYDKSQKNKRHGYGIRNINDRLKLIYGNDYGLTYNSLLGQGTTVTINIPAEDIPSDD